jgi:catechol 2,3-dioxygenase-like lactoylglutathione lyase family enzyme
MLAAAPAAAAKPGKSYFALNVTDAEASARWYSDVFGLKQVNRFDRPNFDQRILDGERLIVELVQLKPAGPAANESALGFTKAGYLMPNFDAAVLEWRRKKVRFFGDGAVFHDAALGLHVVQLLDPDGNIVQVYGKSRISSAN